MTSIRTSSRRARILTYSSTEDAEGDEDWNPYGRLLCEPSRSSCYHRFISSRSATDLWVTWVSRAVYRDESERRDHSECSVDRTENGPIIDHMKTLTISKAKARLGPLTDQIARTGKPVLLRRSGRIFEIRERPMIEPIEFAPVGDVPVSETERELQKLNVFEFGPEVLR